jgi:hypothetical protein
MRQPPDVGVRSLIRAGPFVNVNGMNVEVEPGGGEQLSTPRRR